MMMLAAWTALAAATVFPAPGAKNVPPDAVLQVAWDQTDNTAAPRQLRILDADSGSVADAIDVQPRVEVKDLGGLPGVKYYRVIFDRPRKASFFPRPGALLYGHHYAVEFPGVAGWRFSTAEAPPDPARPRLVVAADGTGDFCTVQGAVDAVTAHNREPRTIFIRRGTYVGMVFFHDKDALTFEGEDRKATVLTYTTNDKFNPSAGNPFAAGAPDPAAQPVHGGHIYRRGVFLAHQARHLMVRNLTIRNTTAHGGSQAEALILNGTPDADARIEHVDLYSFQDTLQINGSARLDDCFFEGDVDFMWGIGPCFFSRCTARSVRSEAFYTQVRNPDNAHGFVFVDCTFTGGEGVRDNYLSRIQPLRFPGSEVVLIDCTLTQSVGRTGWFFQPTAGQIGDTSRVRFFEAGSHRPDGTPVDVSSRNPASHQLTDPAVIARYRSPDFVLAPIP